MLKHVLTFCVSVMLARVPSFLLVSQHSETYITMGWVIVRKVLDFDLHRTSSNFCHFEHVVLALLLAFP